MMKLRCARASGGRGGIGATLGTFVRGAIGIDLGGSGASPPPSASPGAATGALAATAASHSSTMRMDRIGVLQEGACVQTTNARG